MTDQRNNETAAVSGYKKNHSHRLVRLSLASLVLATLSLNSWAFDSAIVNLGDLDGTNGFAISNASESDAMGWAVSNAGDINNDGIDDFVVGAPGTDTNGNDSGAAYVVFGTATGFATPFELSTIANGDGSNGFVLNGTGVESFAGMSLAGGGDVNGDGIEDLVVGAPFANPGGRFYAGSAYVLFGKTGDFGPSVELSSLASGDGSTGFAIHGETVYDQLGRSLSVSADVNGDGISDVVIGAPSGNSFLGFAYIIYGHATGFPAAIEVSTLSVGDGSTGIRLSASSSRQFGENVSEAGDINNDGIDDLIFGTPAGDNNGLSAGEAFVLLGRDFSTVGNFGANMDLSGLDGTQGFVLRGAPASGAGSAVANIGDINGDQIDDILLSAMFASNYDGEAIVVFGKETPFPAVVDLSAVASGDGSDAFIIRASGDDDELGTDVSGIGDFNGDGINDIAIGAPNAETQTPDSALNAGAVFILYGHSDGFEAVITTADIYGGNGTVGLMFVGAGFEDDTGFSVSRAGDVNNDGHDDVIIGSYSPGGSGQQAHVIYGFQSATPDPDLIGQYTFDAHLDDMSAFGNDLVPVGNPVYHTGNEGYSIGLSPSQFVWRGSTPSLASRRDISVAARFKLDANSASPIVAKYTLVRAAGRYQPSYGLEVMTAGRVRFSWLLRGARVATSCTTGYHALNARLENVVAATRDSANGIVRIYVNGVQRKMCRTTPGTLHTDFRPLIVGSWAPGLPAARTGLRLNDLKIYRKTLNVTEVRSLNGS